MRMSISSSSSSFILASAGALALLITGCSAPVDNTANRMEEAPTDPNYPAGPYGYVEDATVANYKFLGRAPMGNGSYEDSMRPVQLGEFHSDGTKLLLIEGSANWCYYCNQEADEIHAIAVENAGAGFKAMTILAEGTTRGVPANGEDVAWWIEKHAYEAVAVGIDPEARLFQYAPTSAFPLHILLDTATMKIKWLCVGGQGGCDTASAVADALGSL
jgi:hypothetical protein